MTQPDAPFALTPFAPRATVAPTTAIQFLGQLDPGSSPLTSALTSPAFPPADSTLAGTFCGWPVREEPFRHVNPANLPAAYRDTPVGSLIGTPSRSPAHPLIELAVLVPASNGATPAFYGDWIVSGPAGLQVWPDSRFRNEFDVPEEAPGSGTGRYGDGSGTGRYGSHGNWTFEGDGTEYPGSYGVGGASNAPAYTPGTGSDGQPLHPFVSDEPPVAPASTVFAPATIPDLAPDTFAAGDTFTAGSSFRIRRADQTVDPAVYVAKSISGGLVSYESDGESLDVSREHIVQVKPEGEFAPGPALNR